MSETMESLVSAALAQAGLAGWSCTNISRLRPDVLNRTAFRIDLDRGGTVKARVLDDDDVASQLVQMRADLPDAFGRVLAQHGRVLIEEWIEGTPLPEPADLSVAAAAGALLGRVHATTAVDGWVAPEMRPTVEDRNDARQALEALEAAGALSGEEIRRFEQALQQFDPGEALVGLTHRDFCGENMVLDRTGRLRVIDNERVGIKALGYDLARTWYRWALPPSAWTWFREHYAVQGPYNQWGKSFRFWQIMVTAQAAALRLRSYPEQAHVPLACLKTLAADV